MSKKKLMACISMALIAVSISACAKIKITVEDDKKETVKEEAKEEAKKEVNTDDKEDDDKVEQKTEKEETKKEESTDNNKFFTGMDYDKIPPVDLDGDGKNETIEVVTDDYISYSVIINKGKSDETSTEWGPANSMSHAYIVDLDKNDNYKELALDWFMRGDNGTDKLLSIFRYDGENVEMVDEVFGTVDSNTGEIIKEN